MVKTGVSAGRWRAGKEDRQTRELGLGGTAAAVKQPCQRGSRESRKLSTPRRSSQHWHRQS